MTALLSRHGLELLLAARPHERDALTPTLGALADQGIPVALWPMLEDHDGRWPSARNADLFDRYVRELLEELRPVRGAFSAIVFDLEPSFAETKAWIARLRGELPTGRHSYKPGRHLAHATGVLSSLSQHLRDEGLGVYAAAVPMILSDEAPPAPGGWQRWMGTPVDALRWDHASVMVYTSIFEGWSRGVLRRADAVALMASCCRATAKRFGAVGGVSLGAVGIGALGDEPVYRGPEELARDVAVARACDIDDLALFDLGGVLGHTPAERWLAAFTETEASREGTELTLRARATVAAAVAISKTTALSALLPAWGEGES